MPRKKLLPDRRLNWRDPNMPVLRMAKPRLPDGTYAEHWTMTEVPPKAAQDWHAFKMQQLGFDEYFKNDPSYWWGKR